jgi:hypothetical protein
VEYWENPTIIVNEAKLLWRGGLAGIVLDVTAKMTASSLTGGN